MVRASQAVIVVLALAAAAPAQTDHCVIATQVFGGPLDDLAFGLQIDAAGNDYLSGVTEVVDPSGSHTDLLALSHDGAGNLRWARRWGTTGDEGSEASAWDGSGGLYLSGEAAGPGSADIPLWRLSAGGSTQWSHLWDAGGDEHVDAAVVDGAGNLFVAGGIRLGGSSEDVLVAKFANARGLAAPPLPTVVTWDRSGRDDSINSGCADASSGQTFLYFAGNTRVPTGGYEVLLQKYDDNLGLQWSRIFSRGTNDDAEVVATNAVGEVYVGGTTRDSGRSDDDGLLLKWDANGNLLWKFQYGDLRDENLSSIAFGPQGTVHVTGQSSDLSSIRGIYLVLDANGNLLRSATYGGANRAALGGLAFHNAELRMGAAVDGPTCNFAPDVMTHGTVTNLQGQVQSNGTTPRGSGSLVPFGAATSLAAGTGAQWDVARLVLQPCPAGFQTFGVGCAGTVGTPTLSAAPGSSPTLGATFSVLAANVPAAPSFPVMLLGVLYPQPIDLVVIGLPGCFLYVQLLIPLGFTTASRWDVRIPVDPCLLGGRFYLQAGIPEPSLSFPVRFTDAGAATIGV